MPQESGATSGDSAVGPTRVYDSSAVDAYIADLDAEIAELRRRLDRAMAGVREAEIRSGTSERAEALLGRALLTAQQAADGIIADAEARARDTLSAAEVTAAARMAEAGRQRDQTLIDASRVADETIANAVRRAGTLVDDADRQSDRLLAEATREADTIVAEARQDAKELREEVRRDAARIVTEAHDTVDAIFVALRSSEQHARTDETGDGHEPEGPDEPGAAAAEPTSAGPHPWTEPVDTPEADANGGEEDSQGEILEMPSPEQVRRLRQAGRPNAGHIAPRPSGGSPWAGRSGGGGAVAAHAVIPDAVEPTADPNEDSQPGSEPRPFPEAASEMPAHVEPETAPDPQPPNRHPPVDESGSDDWPAPTGAPVLDLDEMSRVETAAERVDGRRSGPAMLSVGLAMATSFISACLAVIGFVGLAIATSLIGACLAMIGFVGRSISGNSTPLGPMPVAAGTAQRGWDAPVLRR